ncbi:MAG: electron transfer flavoprotein subunit alpha/FixB family protein [Dehalococcoidia bacterium]
MIEPSYLPQEAHGLWVYLEHEDGHLADVSLEILGKARQLADQHAQRLTAVLLGAAVEPLAEQAISYGADEVLLAEHPMLSLYTTDPYTKVMAGLVLKRKPDILLMGATPNGRDQAGRLAVRLRTGLTADCTDLAIDAASGLLLGEVTGFGRGILATIQCPRHRPQMATVRPGVFPRPRPMAPRGGTVERVAVQLREDEQRVQVLHRSAAKAAADITKAQRLVIGGRGVEGDFALLRRLAQALGAEIGASRVAVDQGWAGHDRQIGQTGCVTRPKLAIVCGVSGALQFIVGIQEAETIVAINSDPEAPIFDFADYCVADDLFQVLPPLIEAVQRTGGGGKR